MIYDRNNHIRNNRSMDLNKKTNMFLPYEHLENKLKPENLVYFKNNDPRL